MTSRRWVTEFVTATDKANETLREEQVNIERLKAQIGLLLDGQSRYVTQIVLQHHLRRVDMVGIHITDRYRFWGGSPKDE